MLWELNAKIYKISRRFSALRKCSFSLFLLFWTNQFYWWLILSIKSWSTRGASFLIFVFWMHLACPLDINCCHWLYWLRLKWWYQLESNLSFSHIWRPNGRAFQVPVCMKDGTFLRTYSKKGIMAMSKKEPLRMTEAGKEGSDSDISHSNLCTYLASHRLFTYTLSKDFKAKRLPFPLCTRKPCNFSILRGPGSWLLQKMVVSGLWWYSVTALWRSQGSSEEDSICVRPRGNSQKYINL